MRLLTRKKSLALSALLSWVLSSSVAAAPDSPTRPTPLGGDFSMLASAKYAYMRGDVIPPEMQRISLFFQGQEYSPLGAREIHQLKVLPARQEGQPMLLATTVGDTAVGTVLIRVQHGVPLSRVLSRSKSFGRPDLGVVQPGRPDVLIFPDNGRALLTNTGQVLWFDANSDWRCDVAGTLVAVSPDNRCGAYITHKGLTTATQDGRQSFFPLTDEDSARHLWSLSQTATAQGRKAFEAGMRDFEPRRYEEESRVIWFAEHLRWMGSSCQLEGLGRTSVLIKKGC